MINKLLENHIKNNVSDKNIAVLLSGGVDSLSVAFACEKLKYNITAYSFKLDNQSNYDFDKAEEVARKMNWKFVECIVPTNNLRQDFLHLNKKYECIKKTHYECVFPFMYLYPLITEKYVISGWAADGYYGVSKKACINYKEPKSKFDEFRDDYFKNFNRAGYNWHTLLAHKHNKIFITPYLDEEVKKYFYQFDWYSLNKPNQKHHVRNAYKEYFDRIDTVKNHINLQIGSGITRLFEKLIEDSIINFKNRKRIMDICRDWKDKEKYHG